MNAFFKMTEVSSTDCPLKEIAKSICKEGINTKSLDAPIVKDLANEKSAESFDTEKIEKKTRRAESNGNWEGEPGNSVWHPDPEYVPPEKSKNPDKPYSNPDSLSWREILNKYGIDGVEFKNGFPVFDEVSKATVKIEGFATGGNDAKIQNFAKADKALAEQYSCRPEDVRAWRKENNYTWHECEDKETMQLVPNEIHANISHDGGRSRDKEASQ